MGLIGITLWIVFWVLWSVALLKARLRFRALGMRFEMGMIEVSFVGAIAILINSYFDPTLESPQVAIWLWVLVGIGLGLVAIAAPHTDAAQDAGNRARYRSLVAKTSSSRQKRREMSPGIKPKTTDATAPPTVPNARPHAAPSTP